MSLGPRIVRFGFVVAILGPITLLTGTAASPQKAASVEGPGPKGADTNSSATARSGGRDRLLQLEQDLSQALKVFKPNTALEPSVPAVRPRVVMPVPNKRARDLEERRKNWLMMNPEDVTATPTLEELFNLPELDADGKLKETPSSLKRLFEGLDPQRQPKAKSKRLAEDGSAAKRKRMGGLDGGTETDDSNEPSGVRSSERDLKNLLGPENSPVTIVPPRNSWLDVFRLGENARLPEQEKAHKAFMDEFRQILDGPKPAVPGNEVLNAITASSPAAPLPAGGVGVSPISSALSRPPGLAPQLGMANPGSGGSQAPDPGAKALNSWNPFYTPTPLQPRTPPPKPNFDVPRRKF